MTRIVGTPLRGIEFNAPGDEAFSSRINLDAQPRIRIDAGGRITWSNGADAGDIKLYRAEAHAIATDGVFSASLGLITRAVEGPPSVAMPDGTILVDKGTNSLYFRSNSTWIAAGAGGSSSVQYLDDLADVLTASLNVGDALKWDGTNWVNGQVSGVAALDDLTDVSINNLDNGQILKYSSSSMMWYNDYEAIQNVDGGLANSVYGGIVALSGGGANG